MRPSEGHALPWAIWGDPSPGEPHAGSPVGKGPWLPRRGGPQRPGWAVATCCLLAGCSIAWRCLD